MRNRIKWILVFILSILLLSYGYSRFRSALSVEGVDKRNKTAEVDSNLIYLYGDSWIGNKSLDKYFKNALTEQGLNYQVKSFGYPGANSKELYETLLGKGFLTSAISILESPPKYCVVIAGVNDAASQMGPKFYSHHTTMIVNTLLHEGITPVLLELPEFGIDKIMNDCGVFIKSKNTLMAFYNNKGETDNILTYRVALKKRLMQEGVYDKIVFVKYNNISSDYDMNVYLYRDAAHLNEKGKIVLCKEIVKQLVRNE